MYLSLAYVETVLAFAILGNGTLIAFWQIFVAAIIVAIALYITLKVKEKNVAQENVEHKFDGEYVTISKQEYENLKAEVERLRELTAEKTPIIDTAETVNPAVLNATVNPSATNGNINGSINGNINGV